MTEFKKTILTTKNQIPFYAKCYEKIGYKLEKYEKSGHFFEVSFVCSGMDLHNELALKKLETKLRVIEMADRKRSRFHLLFINLLVHICLFCIQGAILYHLNLKNAHPKQMLEIGILVLIIFLFIALVIKIVEIFRWSKTINQIKNNVIDELYNYHTEIPTSHNKIISVLFTRNRIGLISKLIYLVTGRQYTHASVGLGEQTECFYSFDYRGFRTEHPSHRKLTDNKKESLCYQFEVSADEYCSLETEINEYLKNKNSFKYNFIGAVFCVLKIYMPLKSHKIYFCSEFVSSQLLNMKSFKLKRSANMYLPTNLAKALVQQDNLIKVIVNEI